MFAGSGMDFVLGTALFVGERTVEIALNEGGTRRVCGRQVVINTGAYPTVPKLDGIHDVDVWTSETILHLNRMPESLTIIGGGYIGCEFASMFAIFGARVTLLQGADQVLPREDPDIADAVLDLLRSQGVEVRLGARVSRVSQDEPGGEIIAILDDGGAVASEALLVATGRTPVTAGLGLDAAGVEVTDRGFVAVDDQLRTSAPQVWAAGDVAGSPPVHPCFVERLPHPARDLTGVGHQASSGGALASLLGADSGEVITALQMAMLGGLPYQQVRDAVITHPTMGEGLNLLFDNLGDEDS